MAVAHFRAGNKEQAARNLHKTLELNPKNYDAAELLKQLR